MACVIAGAGAIIPASVSSNEALAAGSQLTLSEDSSSGRITVDTSTVKAVWHYKTLAQENYNQGGGNLYELYYKPLDPSAGRNLVSMENYGNARSTTLWAGIGGVGGTDLYASDTLPGSSQNNSFYDVISDNNSSGTLESHSASVDDEGNAVLSFTYRVHNQSSGKDWYRVVKTWTMEPGGAIHLGVTWSLLASGYFSEMAVRSNWSYDVGWDRFSKYGRDWTAPNSPNAYLLGMTNIEDETAECWDALNQFLPDWVALTGSPDAPTLKMSADNNGQGFRGGGTYQLGSSVWNTPANPTAEQCSILGGEAGAHVINWMTWWGGNPPAGSRYKWLNAGTTWSDSYRIDLSVGTPGGGPDISSVATTASASGTRVTWNSDVESDSVVEVMGPSGSWTSMGSNSSMTTSHSVTVGGLTEGNTYSFRVKSQDAGGHSAVSGGYQFMASSAQQETVQMVLAQQSTAWKSYADYVNRQLTVDFLVKNQGTGTLSGGVILDAVSNNYVSTTTNFPVSIGDVAPGGSATLTVTYLVPQGLDRFETVLSGTGIGPDGNSISFP